MPATYEISFNTVKRLRKLRLWHWRQCLRNRTASETAAKADDPVSQAAKAFYDARANHHIRAVQALNDFFPEIGDTAENDAANEDAGLALGYGFQRLQPNG
jgi:hypothetical protein